MPHGGLATELATSLRSLLSQLAALDLTELTDNDVHTALPELLGAVDQLCGVTSAVVGSFDTRGLSDVDACRTTRTWLQAVGRMSQGAAGSWIKRARLMANLPAVGAAAKAGRVSAEQLKVIDDLAHAVGVEQVQPTDAMLAALCGDVGKDEVVKACERIYAHVNPDGPHPDPQDLHDKRELILTRSGHMTYLRGRLDPEGAAVLSTALDALMRPPAPDETSTAPQRRCDALVELGRLSLARGQLPEVGGHRPQVAILITPAMLLSGSSAEGLTALDNQVDGCPAPAAGHANGPPPTGPPKTEPPDELERIGIPHLPDRPWMGWVDHIPEAVAQRIACDCETWRQVLDQTTGQVLELGRTHRLVPPWLRKALVARDHGCRWPGCTAPAAWTDAHHIIPWWTGGRTDIENLLLLCRYHHVKVHEGRWHLRFDHRTGEVSVTRPDGRRYQPGVSRSYVSPGRKAPPGSI